MRVHEAVRSPFGNAETAFHWGQLLLDRDRARTLLGIARQLAGRYGFGDIERRADEALLARRRVDEPAVQDRPDAYRAGMTRRP